MKRYKWAWMPVVAWFLCGPGPRGSSAQTLAPPSTASPTAVRMIDPRRVKESPPIRAVQTLAGIAGPQGRADRDLPSALPIPTESGLQFGGRGDGGTAALARDVTLRPAPFESGDERFPINLATALRLSDARPLIVAAAQASVWIAEAELTRAKVLWVPTLNLGFDYVRHDGGGPDFNKGIMTAPSVNFFYGGGGMWGNLPLADAIFQPLAARQTLNAAHWNVQTAKNDALLQTADSYFRVHQSRGIYTGALYTVERGHDLVGRILQLSRELVPSVEVERARNMLADLEQQSVKARQDWRVASADLTQVLRLDPRAVLEPLEHDHAQITIIDPSRPFDELMPIALTNRPELSAYRALVDAAIQRIRMEKARPFVPNFLINGFQTPYEMIQAGIFGLGPNSSLNQWAGRVDLSYQPLWQLDAFGIGNLARIKAARGAESKAIIDFLQNQDAVAADVTRAVARVQSAAVRVIQADRALRSAIITFNGSYEGLQQTTRLGNVLVLVNRPQEAVFALQLLKVAFDHYFTTVGEYNRSQFELFHALGYPARELTELRPAGMPIPVDTSRPSYLPPVGNGPPPASR